MTKTFNIFILVLIAALLLVSNSVNYAQEYIIKNYPIIESSRGTKVIKTFQDKRGFLWFATTDGVYRFDGRRFTRPANLDIEASGSIMDITQDEKGYLWFSAIRGLFRFDGTNITKYSEQKYIVQKTLIDKYGIFWTLISSKLYRFKDYKFQNQTVEAGLEKVKRPEIIIDKSGELLITTSSGFKKYSNGTFNVIKDYDPLYNQDLSAIFMDKSKRLWAGYKNGKIKSYSNNKITQYTLPGKGGLNRVFSITEDSRDNIWICSREGLFRFDGNKFTTLTLSKDTLSKFVNSLFEDNEGNLWASTNTGAYKITKKEYSKVNSDNKIDFNMVSSIAEDNEGKIWFGSISEGLMVFDGRDFTKIKNYKDIDLTQIGGLKLTKDGYLWIATMNGLVKYKNGKFHRYTTADGLQKNNVTGNIIEDGSGNIYFRNYYYICKFDGKDFTYPIDLRQSHIRLFFNGLNDEILLFGENGIKDLELRDRIVFNSDFFMSRIIGRIVIPRYDKENNLWVGVSKYGFGRLSADGKFKEVISSNDGMLDNIIYSMMIDSRDFLWIGTGSGISKFNLGEYKKTGKKIFENFRNPEYEITNQIKTIFQDSNNNVWIGTSHGIMKFTRALDDNATVPAPRIHLTGLKLHLEDFNYGLYSDSTEHISGIPKNLKLPYNKNYLTFSFVGLNYTSPEEVQYKYKLSGFDSSWSPSIRNNEVTYTNLLPGEYKFEVRARNENGLWSTEEASISFVVEPPFWKTWWFYLLCIIVGTIAVFGYTKARTFQLEKQKLELENTVSLRTMELLEEKAKVEEANYELEKKRQQLAKINELQEKWLTDLSESERLLSESNSNKDKLFSIISHDLKSPFRSLLLFSENVIKKIEVMSVDEIKEYTLNVHKTASNVYSLMENLLEWSRLQIGRIEINPCRFNICNAVKDTVLVLEGNARRKNIDVINNVGEDFCIFADENTIRSVLNNLISNAIKFTNRGGLVKVDSKADDGYVEIAVCDNGIGLTTEEMSKLFRVDTNFFRNGTDNEKGTGLGLILCKELIEKNNGSIVVRSEAGKGSTFSFIIPVPGDK